MKLLPISAVGANGDDAVNAGAGPGPRRSGSDPLSALDGLGPLSQWLADESVTEVMVNGPGPVWVERGGRLHVTTSTVEAYELAVYIERIVAPLGLRLDRVNPICDARLPDGSRVNIVAAPVAVGGPCVTIRRFASTQPRLVDFGPPSIQAKLGHLVEQRASILIVGATGTGKTTLINTLGTLMAPTERVVCIEDTAELRLDGPNIVRLETRPANSEGVGAVTMRHLVTNALRMRPDRLVLGEVRGPEALDLILALTAGHAGSMATCHAPNAARGLHRLALLASLAPESPPLSVLHRFVADAFDSVVHLQRCPGSGRRQVSAVVPVAQTPPDTA